MSALPLARAHQLSAPLIPPCLSPPPYLRFASLPPLSAIPASPLCRRRTPLAPLRGAARRRAIALRAQAAAGADEGKESRGGGGGERSGGGVKRVVVLGGSGRVGRSTAVALAALAASDDEATRAGFQLELIISGRNRCAPARNGALLARSTTVADSSLRVCLPRCVPPCVSPTPIATHSFCSALLSRRPSTPPTHHPPLRACMCARICVSTEARQGEGRGASGLACPMDHAVHPMPFRAIFCHSLPLPLLLPRPLPSFLILPCLSPFFNPQPPNRPASPPNLSITSYSLHHLLISPSPPTLSITSYSLHHLLISPSPPTLSITSYSLHHLLLSPSPPTLSITSYSLHHLLLSPSPPTLSITSYPLHHLLISPSPFPPCSPAPPSACSQEPTWWSTVRGPSSKNRTAPFWKQPSAPRWAACLSGLFPLSPLTPAPPSTRKAAPLPRSAHHLPHAVKLPSCFDSTCLLSCPLPTLPITPPPPQTPYVDVCDDVAFAGNARSLHRAAVAAGVPAITTAGIYPGVSNCQCAQGGGRDDGSRAGAAGGGGGGAHGGATRPAAGRPWPSTKEPALLVFHGGHGRGGSHHPVHEPAAAGRACHGLQGRSAPAAASIQSAAPGGLWAGRGGEKHVPAQPTRGGVSARGAGGAHGVGALWHGATHVELGHAAAASSAAA
ncbi:unnamed protein product, partial [Closterium sp. NIES-53]